MINEAASDIIGLKVISKLRERYPEIHPVMFLRSMEKARSPGDLFDILDTFPGSLPVEWNKTDHRWQTVNVPGNPE